MLQLTHVTDTTQRFAAVNSAGGSVDMQYVYNTGHNNRSVTQTIDNVLGETVNYTYDYLHRLPVRRRPTEAGVRPILTTDSGI